MTNQPAKPRFFVFEGGEGAGKGTQFRLLKQALEAAGHPLITSREPGGTKIGEALRAILKTDLSDPDVARFYPQGVTVEEQLIMFCTARITYLHQVVKPALQAGNWILSDRFTASTMAYQGYAGGLDLGLVEKMIQFTLRDIRPDLTLILDVPVDVGLARRAADAADGSFFEDKGPDFHEKVRQGYLHLAKTDPANYLAIDGTPDVATVHRVVVTELNSRFGLSLQPQA